MACARETRATISHKDEELLTCPICQQLFCEPMSLPCGHTYCLPCLDTMSAGLDRNNCPECQQEYGGTGALVKNMKMCSMVEAHKVSLGRNIENKSSLDCAKEMTPTKCTEETRSRETASTQNQLDSSTCQKPQKKNLPEGQDGPRAEFDSSGPLPTSPEQPPPAPPEQQGITTKKTEMDEPKFRLASQVTELSVRLEMAEGVLRREKQLQEDTSAANEELRGGTAALLHAIRALSLDYSEAVTRLIEGELSPVEAALSAQVSRATRLTEELRHCVLSAESLLTEEDEAAFTQDLDLLQPRIAHLIGQPPAEEDVEPDGGGSKIDTSLACAKLEEMNTDFKAGMGDIHRKLRNALNPSEVTFDPDTAHPNLVLSGDMKTVTYSAAKRPYPASPRRFTNLLQVLSSQSFYSGEHRWRVELEGSPWVVGVCHSGQLARSGLASALESSRGSWCLMWFENRLRAFERGHDVPLKLTALSRTLEVRLSFRTHRLSFYDVGASGGKTHVYTFKAPLTEPVHLAYRMLSGDAKARVTIGEA